MELGDTPDMAYGRLLEAAHVSGYTFERVCGELEWLLTEERWRQLGPGYADINAFLRSIDFSAFNLQEKRPELVQRIKALQPGASNRAIAEAIGVSRMTINRDIQPGTDVPVAAEGAPVSEERNQLGGTSVPPAPESAEADDEAEAEVEEELPAFLLGDDWSPRQRSQALAHYRSLPAALQPTVADLLEQPGICVPDIVTMLAHIAGMPAAQQAELVRLQASADAYERNCAITMALDRPPPPHPRIMLLYDVRRELLALSHRVEGTATRYPTLPGASDVVALALSLAAKAPEVEALIHTLQETEEAMRA